jgi:hypothetical protein
MASKRYDPQLGHQPMIPTAPVDEPKPTAPQIEQEPEPIVLDLEVISYEEESDERSKSECSVSLK